MTPDQHLTQLEAILVQSQELMSESFSKGQAYNNAVIMIGFGGVFALLAVTKDHMPPFWLFTVAGLTTFSLFCFVFYLVSVMFQFSAIQLRSSRQLLKEITSIQSSANLDTSRMAAQLKSHDARVWVWLVVWVASVFPGFAAGGIMMWFYFFGVLAN